MKAWVASREKDMALGKRKGRRGRKARDGGGQRGRRERKGDGAKTAKRRRRPKTALAL